MATEIELKVHIDDPQLIRKQLSNLGEYLTAYEKDDTYWFLSSNGTVLPPEKGVPDSKNKLIRGDFPPSGLRIRSERDTLSDGKVSEIILVTYKMKEISGGIEINDEREFEVSHRQVFMDLLRRLGLKPGINKHKQGWAWYCGVIRAELSDVRDLGWFLELEIISDKNDPQTVETCREQLFGLLDKLEISRDKIEERPYTLMLKSRQ
jgi:adenylate cyclase class 2